VRTPADAAQISEFADNPSSTFVAVEFETMEGTLAFTIPLEGAGDVML
jgi:hypothetical protein